MTWELALTILGAGALACQMFWLIDKIEKRCGGDHG